MTDSDSIFATADVRRVPATERVADALRELILAGDLDRGEPLREADLADRLEVSRQSVREALQRLVTDGLVEYSPYRGARVRTFTVDDAEDLFRLRQLIELTAVDAAVDGDPAARERIVQAARELEQAARREDTRALVMADAEFHASLVDAMGIRRLSVMYRSLMSELWLLSSFTDREQASLDLIAAGHVLIADAIRRQDRDRAKTLLDEHLKRSLADALRGINS